MRLTGIYSLDASLTVLLMIGCMMLASEVGYRIGVRRHPHAGERGRGHFGGVLGSMLGLVALMLGFTFNVSLQRYETRRQLVMADANALNAVYLQSSMIPEPGRKEFKRRLRQYVDLRTDTGRFKAGITQDDFAQLVKQTDALHRQMWEQVRSIVQARPPVAEMGTMLTLLSNAQSVNRQRIFAYLGRVPRTIIWMLLGATIIAMGAVGLAGGLGTYRGMPARILLTLLLSGAIFIILDLDQPQSGFTKVDQGPLMQVRAIVDGDPEAMP